MSTGRPCATCGAPVNDMPPPEGDTRESLEEWIRAKAKGHSEACLALRLKGLDDALMGIDWGANGNGALQ